jgi:RHS repeat-associated protein
MGIPLPVWVRSSGVTRQLNTLSDRTAAVQEIRVSPSKLVAYASQVVGFSAIGNDATSTAVQGPKFDWSVSDSSTISIDESGKARMLKPGLCWITCSAGSVHQRVPVLVRPGARPSQSMSDWIKDQNSLDQNGNVSTGGFGMASLLDKLAPTAEAQSSSGPMDYLWNYIPNLTGNPRNRMIVPTRIGAVLPESSNFNLPIPLVNLPGRGLNLNLTAYYNSRMWFRNGNTIVYNPLGGYPAPGFSLGFGYILMYLSSYAPYDTAYAFVDRDGTFRYLGHGNPNTAGTYQTQDGTHIIFTGYQGGGTLSYTDGTQVTISLINNNLLPTQVMDRNGNYMTIAYKDATQGYKPLAIDFITDTLGRNVQFHYNGSLNLDYIVVPAMNGGTGSSVFFSYSFHSLGYNFSGLTPMMGGPSGPFLDSIELATGTGMTLSYSQYGMAYNVSLRRQMSLPNGNGIESASMNFNYPTSGSTVLTDAPTFTQYTDSPGGSYSISSSTNTGNQTLAYAISRPDLSAAIFTRSTNSSSVANGLMTQGQINNSAGALMAQSVYSYANDPGGSPQVQSVIDTNDAGQQTQVNYDYSSGGFVTNVREFGFQQSGSWVVRRRTAVTYGSFGGATLPNEKDLYDALLDTNDGNDVLIAKTTYTYDNYAALGGLQDYGGTATPPGHLLGINGGNMTGETQWTDIANNLSIIRLAQIDIFGNVVKAQLSCCNQKTMIMDQSTYWSNATQVTRGASGGPQLTDTVTYDFNTSKKTGLLDPNDLSTSYQYDANLRPIIANLPSGATATFGYNDSSLFSTVGLNYTDGGVNMSPTGTTYSNGWGWKTQTVDVAGNVVNSAYDSMGRLQSVTNPFPQNGSPGPSTTYQYDALGRQTLASLPDGNTLQTSYSGNTVTFTDQVGRKRQRFHDGLAHMAAVSEQDPGSGAMSQVTTYAYNYFDQITQCNQGGQLRSYKYDALARLIYESIPEQTATINDGTGAFWTSKYTYTDFGAIASKTDSRGVVVSYGYDSLNRNTSISYDTSNAPGVASTPNVTYNYDNSTTSTTKGLLLSVSVGGSYTESYGYDSSNRISSVAQVIDGKSYTTSYQYNQAGQKTQMTYPSGTVLPYVHDSFGRLCSIGGTGGNRGSGCSNGYLNSITYTPAERAASYKLGNGVQETLTYDSSRLLLTGIQATMGSTTLMNLTYGYSAAAGQMGVGTTAGNTGQLVSVSGTINGAMERATYNYDVLRRLASASQSSNGATAERGFVYDRWANRTGVYNAVSGGSQIQRVTLQQANGVPTNGVATVSSAGESVYNTPGQCGSPTTVNVNRTGRYVMVQLMGANYLHLAEVQVIGTSGQNLALGKPSAQSSTALGAAASRANDGNTDGNFADGSVSHTNLEYLPWWYVDLGSSQQITSINVWNRTDCCSSRTSNFNVIVSDQPIATRTYLYDAAGNVFFDGLHSYTYDGENRLTSIDGGATAQYSYDYSNERVKKVAGGATIHYIWQGGSPIAEHDGATGHSLSDYILAGRSFVAKLTATGTVYFLRDRLGERLEFDSSGNVLGAMGTLPFGEDFAESGQQDKHHFTSYERDSESGADYALNRLYSSGLGRFTTVDWGKSSSASSPQSLNRYTYALGDPSNLLDPSGLDPFAPGGGGGGSGDPNDPNSGVIRPCGWDPRGPGLLDTGIADELIACMPGDPPPQPITAGGGDPGSSDPGPSCTMTVDTTKLHTITNSPLLFPSGNNIMGPNSWGVSKNNGVTTVVTDGYFWQSYIFATVSDPRHLQAQQEAWVSVKGTFWDGQNLSSIVDGSMDIHVKPQFESANLNTWQGGNILAWTDTPAFNPDPYKAVGLVPYTLSVTWKIHSWVDVWGQPICDAWWGGDLEFKKGQYVSFNFTGTQ